jgi:hypothetical protein
MDCADRIAEKIIDLEAERDRLNWPEGRPLIVCPTHGRAGKVRVTERLFPGIPICVAESQAPLYKEAHPDLEQIVHPDHLIGIAPKRQWLLDNYGDVMMFDDDVARVYDLSISGGEGANAQVDDPEFLRELVYRLFRMAEQIGAYLVGFSNFAHPAAYRPQRPFGLTGAIAGRNLGLRAGSKLFFPDSKLLMTDDLYVSALNAHFHRYLLRDERYCFVAPGTWANDGGMAVHRTWDRMIENNRLLKELFGDAIVSKSPTVIAGLSHEAQLTLKVPW